MDQAIQAAGRYLPRKTVDRIIAFLADLQIDDGGFRGRSTTSDLYYTAFAAETLAGLSAPPDAGRLLGYLAECVDPSGLDLVHLASWIRCAKLLGADGAALLADKLADERLGAFYDSGGGYRLDRADDGPSVYGSFMALYARQCLSPPIPPQADTIRFVQSCRRPDGGFANQPNLPAGTTPTTAAAVILLHEAQQPVCPETIDWLRARGDGQSGFYATETAPVPDLLSTATALHALAERGVCLQSLREASLDYIHSLWNPRGGFHGHWADPILDAEYTFYGVLAIGHLA
ncbi:MAG: terpene cyclase/mutase family protein [Sedimentisphaerales bacterium]|nr:terpene cyclase/mutase family protein [Sedimentisphaerales bacterium]